MICNVILERIEPIEGLSESLLHPYVARKERAGIDISQASIDSTSSKHQSAHDSKKDQAVGKSKGGWNTKSHALVDAFGQALDFVLGPGNRHDMTGAEQVFVAWRPAAYLVTKATTAGRSEHGGTVGA